MENLNNHREQMAGALNAIDMLFNALQVTHREKEVARERFAECNYWLARLYGRLEAELVEAAPYVWHQKDGAGTDPGIALRQPVPVNVLTGDTAAQVAFKTQTAINQMFHEETPIKTSVKKKKK